MYKDFVRRFQDAMNYQDAPSWRNLLSKIILNSLICMMKHIVINTQHVPVTSFFYKKDDSRATFHIRYSWWNRVCFSRWMNGCRFYVTSFVCLLDPFSLLPARTCGRRDDLNCGHILDSFYAGMDLSHSSHGHKCAAIKRSGHFNADNQ
jgi:hypothetical protein